MSVLHILLGMGIGLGALGLLALLCYILVPLQEEEKEEDYHPEPTRLTDVNE